MMLKSVIGWYRVNYSLGVTFYVYPYLGEEKFENTEQCAEGLRVQEEHLNTDIDLTEEEAVSCFGK